MGVSLNKGPVDCSKTVVISNSHTMVAQRGIYNTVLIEPKDYYGNSASMEPKNLDMVVVKVTHI